jgi:hypothetical protein
MSITRLKTGRFGGSIPSLPTANGVPRGPGCQRLVNDFRSLIPNKIKPALGTRPLHTAVAEAGTVPERMGHGSLAVTSGYMHRVSEADRAAAGYMGALVDDSAS